ncbi:efflux RND transporter permease subunit [Beggiatoa leptomitoformis]|uniref:AcrB/AcrD/AcrF family protein n=1 Tax=Beggiatoa leptomitoformis TaxID=288004 RepID=A0A2N9YB04_9GAMM|nr:efflux RND transporter permease subunit [Beggiatoa leptomitoformis]ALG67015.1 AcrB/AcrD/AcrF family protein [Beggiatoa leptomitoformis]AUI67609.1 AcrB/AcrD/AcrF family protein [Beggiatoa leptomitoformis]
MSQAQTDKPPMGISGRITQQFLTTQITPLLALVGLLLGLFAIAVTPREEEPQINVTFANVFIPFPGASVRDVEQIVATPAEQKFSEIEGIEHIYSVSRPGMAVLTVQFKVGEPRTDAIVRLYNTIYSNSDWLPQNLGVGTPLLKPKGIDDVPIVTLTLWSEEGGSYDLQDVAHTIESELKRVNGTRDIYTVGGADRIVHVTLDPNKLAGYQLSITDLTNALSASNSTRNAGSLVRDNQEILVQAGDFLSKPEEIADLVVGMQNGKAIYLHDVADVRLGAAQPEQYVWFGTGAAAHTRGITQQGEFPAVTIAIAKQPGTNAVAVANQVIERFEAMRGVFVPDDVHVTVTRNYGETADAKAKKLISKLIFATSSVVLLVLITLGWREAFIVGTAVVITLLITLFASWAWGFTLNRVSLFALIFSIGILVDDAIVVVENIHRHIHLGAKNLLEAIPVAVDEVGGPTILATFTVIAALLPMAFVSGLMGPYMSPIPINASLGMLISLAVAYVFTPWLTYKVLRKQFEKYRQTHQDGHPVEDEKPTTTYRLFNGVMRPFLRRASLRWLLLLIVLAMIAGAVLLPITQHVVLKMLPFDNKSEFQVVLDMPEGTSVEQTARVLGELGRYLAKIEEVSDYQVYAGTSAPISFNGLVRQYYLRSGANVGDIQVNLTDSHHRQRKSHEIALSAREPLQAIGAKYNANVKIVEVPPGPPVQSPLVVEVYGLDYKGQINIAKDIRAVFAKTPDIIDVDDTIEAPQTKLIVRVDQSRAALLGVSQDAAVSAIQTVLQGADVSFLHNANVKYPIPIRFEYSTADKADIERIKGLRVRSNTGNLVPLSEFTEVVVSQLENAIYHKDLLPLTMVTGDMAGKLDSPLYGMYAIYEQLQELTVEEQYKLDQYFIQQPANPYRYSIKWDGEWQVTYETFRDMGIAYAVGMIMIYLLVVAQFHSYLVPLIIMAPIPLTVIGVMPGHALLGAQFTATSMIGMIALAGIIVRNSILLVDFINQQIDEGMAFQEAVIRSSAVRAQPIVLTGLAAMVGAFFIIDDPIFSGLAIALIFGLFVSTVLTLVVIPILYYAFMHKRFA